MRKTVQVAEVAAVQGVMQNVVQTVLRFVVTNVKVTLCGVLVIVPDLLARDHAGLAARIHAKVLQKFNI